MLWQYTYYGRYDFFRLQRNGVALFGRPKRQAAGAEGDAKAEAAAAGEAEGEAEGEADMAVAEAEAAAEAAAQAEAEEAAAAAEATAAEDEALEWRHELHQSIVRRADRGAEAAWLADVEHVHAPALRRSMEAAQSRLPQSTRDSGFCDGAGATGSSGGVVCVNGGGNVKWREAPPPAAATLSLLRAIAAHGSTTKEGDGCTGWPATSIARSRVIRGSELRPPEVTTEGREGGKSSTVNRGNGRRGNATNGGGSRPNNGGSSTGNPGDGSRSDGGPNGNGTSGDGSRPTNGGTSPNNGGSLTVVNVALVDAEAIHVPRANALFPEMAISVFELEVWLIAQHGLLRPPSTHCAVRRNAHAYE